MECRDTQLQKNVTLAVLWPKSIKTYFFKKMSHYRVNITLKSIKPYEVSQFAPSYRYLHTSDALETPLLIYQFVLKGSF